MSVATADPIGRYSASAESTSVNTQSGPPAASFSTLTTLTGTGSFTRTISLSAGVGFCQVFCRASDSQGCLGDPIGYPGGGHGTVDYTIDIVARVASSTPRCTINVTTNLPAATFSITGPATFSGNGTSYTTSAPAGDYAITFGPVSGYTTPPSQTKILAAGGSITFDGSYQSTTAGTINVTTNLAAAAYSITGPATFSGGGTSYTRSNAPPGGYTITFGSVEGYLTPASESLTLTSGGVISFLGIYQKECLFTISPTFRSHSKYGGLGGIEINTAALELG